MSSTPCATKSFVKGFDSDFKPICVPYNSPTHTPISTPNPSFTTPSTPTGEMPGGKFGTYFKNIANICDGNKVIKGFTAQGQKICVDARNRLSVDPISEATLSPTITGISPPGGEPNGGNFSTYFGKVINTSCPAKQAIKALGADGTPQCDFIPEDGICGTSNNASVYNSTEITNLCTSGTPSSISGTGPWNWTCAGSDGGASDTCTAKKKVDCAGYWTENSTCSAACGGGTKQKVYTVTTAAQNGGNACPATNGATIWGTTTCNTNACAPLSVINPDSRRNLACPDAANSAAAWCATTTCPAGTSIATSAPYLPYGQTGDRNDGMSPHTRFSPAVVP